MNQGRCWDLQGIEDANAKPEQQHPSGFLKPKTLNPQPKPLNPKTLND